MTVSAGSTGAHVRRFNKTQAARFLSNSNLYILGLLCVALTISGACLAIWQLRRDRITDVWQDTHNLAVLLAAQTDRSFQAIDLVLREVQDRARTAGVADHRLRDNLGSEETHRFLVDRVRNLPQIDAMALTDSTGRVVNLSRAWPAPAVDLSDRDFFTYWHDHDEPAPFIGAPIINKITGKRVLTVTRRINGPNGEFLGIAAAAIPLSYFEAFFKAIDTEDGEAVSLFRRDGVLLARHPYLEPMIGEKISAQSHWYDALRAGGGTYLTSGYVGGVPRIISLQPVSAYPLAITVGVAEAQALALWRRQATMAAIGAGTAVVGFALLFWALERQFRRLSDSEARFRNYATISSDWFWETDAQHRISYMSEGVSTTGFGVKPSQLIGRTRMEIAADAGAELDKWRDHRAALERHEPFRNLEYRWSNPGGQGIATISGDPIFDPNGRFIGYRGTGRDVTPLKAAEATLRQTQDDLNHAQQLAKIGTDVWDIRTGRIEWSAELYRILGLDPATFTPSLDSFVELAVPEDRPVLLARRAEAAAGRCPPPGEFSIRRPDGAIRRLRSEGALVLDEEGTPLRWVRMRQDITEQSLIEQNLRDAKEAAEAANLAKSQFLANMSHELRTPLNAINGFSEGLELGIAGKLPERAVEYAQLIHQSGEHLLRVINDILDLAKVDAGKFELREEEGVDPDAVIEACFTLVRSQAVAGSVLLSREVDDPLPCLIADPTRLKQILLNLLSNAIKFTEPGGSVTLRVGKNIRGDIIFEIHDTGLGMTTDELVTALQPFGQVDASNTRRYEGTGLGLPLAKRLTELHGGSLEIDSEKGRGTSVIVTFPAFRVVPSQIIAAPAPARV